MLELIFFIFSTACLILIPLGIVAYFINSLLRYFSDKSGAAPDSYKRMTLRLHLIVSSVLLAFTVLMVICSVVLMSGDISFM